MIPLISSLSYGPLEVLQLPRFWWKVLLRKANLLDSDYPDCSGGLDTSVLEVLDLDKETTLSYLRDNMPNYLEFEDWVLQQKGGSLDREAIDKWNESIRTRVHRPAKIAETYRDIGFGDDVNINSAVILNSLQDWQFFHRQDFDGDIAHLGARVVPLIATIDYGPLEVCQLPRTWLKILLKAKGVLHPDYPDMTENGLDPRVLRALKIKPSDAVTYIRENQPTYLQFEGWVLEQNGGEIDREPVEEWNAFVRNRTRNDSRRSEILATVGLEDDGTLISAVVLNHIDDWHLAHANLSNARKI
ncbi:hypothetical protein IH992_25525 [Candidatus Poribacteria bacterium]|nr:hypothetical protein [Candidatus Poribacteria bacterium]